MPWTCPNAACGVSVALDSVAECPACKASNTSWTLPAGMTRRLVVARPKRFECRRGRRVAPDVMGVTSARPAIAWPRTTTASVLTRDEVAGLRARGALPDPADLLCVRLWPQPTLAEWRLVVSVYFETKDVEERVFELVRAPDRLGDAGELEALFLFSRGDVPIEDLARARIHVVDVGEETPLGHAPRIEVAALRSKGLSVTLERPPAPPPITLRLQVHDTTWTPCRDAPFELHDASGAVARGTTDGDGWLEQTVAPGQVRLVVSPPGRPPLRFTLEAHGSGPGGDAELLRHVQNLGFDDARPEVALHCLQGALGLPLTGRLDDETRAALQRLAAGEGGLGRFT